MPFVSYAQNQEDVLLNRCFGGQATGFYIDIGASHPLEASVTKAFYERGWCGINIEPGPIFDTLKADRPRDICLRMAVTDFTGEVGFIDDDTDTGMSRVAQANDPGAVLRKVPCDTLISIVEKYSKRRVVDFLKIDVEGSEGAIIKSTDWAQFRPRIIVIEATLPWTSTLSNEDWEPVLLAADYVRVYFDGINCFYVRKEELYLQKFFATPVNVLDSAVSYSWVTLNKRLAENQFTVGYLARRAIRRLRKLFNPERPGRNRVDESRLALERARDEQDKTISTLRHENELLQTELAALRNAQSVRAANEDDRQ